MLPTHEMMMSHPTDYLYLKRKRQFTMDNTKVVYGEGGQTHFTVVFSPNKLEDQYPIFDLEIRSKTLKPKIVDFKNEYFLISDSDVSKHLSDDTMNQIKDKLSMFLTFEDWQEPDHIS